MATRETKETLLRRIAYLESNERRLENEAKEANNHLHDAKEELAELRDLLEREKADHMLTLGNLKDQTRIAGLLAVGGKTSYQPQIEHHLSKRMSATDGCAPRRCK